MALAAKVAQLHNEQPCPVAVDEIGVGEPVLDCLRELAGGPLTEQLWGIGDRRSCKERLDPDLPTLR